MTDTTRHASIPASAKSSSNNSENDDIIVDGIKSHNYLQHQVISVCKNVAGTVADFIQQRNSESVQYASAMEGRSTRWNYKWEVNDRDWFNREREEVFMPDSDTVKIVLLIIDPQNDFHDDPPDANGKTRGYTGSLAVGGATADSLRLSEMIRRNIHDIDEIYVTLDTHHVSFMPCFVQPAISLVFFLVL